MQKFLIQAKGRRTLVDSWQDVYDALCYLHSIDAISIGEEQHMDFANAESWCESLCFPEQIYSGRTFTIEVFEDLVSDF